MQIMTYRVPPNGLGTDFTEFDRPMTFATTYENRFRNATGGAERRPGMQIFSSSAVPSFPNLTRLHEFVDQYGNETLLSSDDFGNIWTFNSSAGTWAASLTGKAHLRMISAEADGKLIFVNGSDRNFYTEDGGQNYKELKAIINVGTLAAGSSASSVRDGNVSNWTGTTFVANNDIVHNLTKNTYGIVTAIASAALTVTTMGSAGTGAGFGANQAPGDAYELIDYVDLNIIPIGASNNSDGLGYDNVATLTAGSSVYVVAVSGVNFSQTEIRVGDFIYNTTRGGIDYVYAVSANVVLQHGIGSQTTGDAVVFFKSAMPIASWVHVHYGRVAYLDSRNNNRIVFSAPDDPQDVTTYQKTLDATSFSFATQQPTADSLISMETFLSYFVAAGKRNLYIYQGNNPIKDESTDTIDFTPIAFYPNGIASRFGLETNGGDLLHMTVDGLQAITIGYSNFSVNQNNASVPILSQMRQALESVTNTDNIQVAYYPRRRWLLCKINSQIFVLNTQPSYDQTGQQQQIASWHLFTGGYAQLNHYFVRRNGNLLGCGANGGVYYLDSSASTDVGTQIQTNLSTAWLRLEEPQITPRIKELLFIRPILQSSPDVEYTITVQAGLDNYSSDSITVSAGGTGAIGSGIVGITPIGGGSFAQTIKYPLRARGEEMQIGFQTESSAAEDIISSFTLYGNISGIR